MIRKGMHPSEATRIDVDEAIVLIREALRQRSGKSWSVKRGSGTGYGWITVSAPPKRMVDYGMSEDDRAELGRLFGKDVHCQGLKIPADYAYRRHYVALAMGLESLTHAAPYWD